MPKRLRVLFMASEQAFWKSFCEAVGRMDLFERWPGSKYADHARGNVALRHELAHLALLHGEPKYLSAQELDTFSADERFPARGWEYYVSRLGK